MPEAGSLIVPVAVDSTQLRAALAVLGEAFAGLADYLHECATKVDGAILSLEAMDAGPAVTGDPQ